MTDTTKHDVIIEDLPGEHAHETPTELFYVKVALVLGVLTAIEVALYYVELDKLPMVLALCALAICKFALVALFFMHLRFDSPLFRRLFATGIIFALAVYTIALLTFGVFLDDRSGPERENRPHTEGSL